MFIELSDDECRAVQRALLASAEALADIICERLGTASLYAAITSPGRLIEALPRRDAAIIPLRTNHPDPRARTPEHQPSCSSRNSAYLPCDCR